LGTLKSVTDPNERIARIQLYRTPHVGPATFHQLLSQFGSACAAVEELPNISHQNSGKQTIQLASRDSIMRELDAHKRVRAQLIVYGDDDYPGDLTTLTDMPPVLSMRGRGDLLRISQLIGIVGARNASLAGKKIAWKLARQLGERGYGIISGLARGIDASAHQGSIDTGTIAVIAGGD
jgi:DNA processing protein